MRRGIFAVPIVLAVGGCQLGEDYPGGIEFENPFCQDVTMTFTDTGSLWEAEETISNVISDDEELVSIVIRDSTGSSIDLIDLWAPADASGGECPFYYPATRGTVTYTGNVFHKEESSGTATYTAENTEHRYYSSSIEGVEASCPVEGHLGNWTLRMSCPSSAASSSFTRTFEVCFYYEE